MRAVTVGRLEGAPRYGKLMLRSRHFGGSPMSQLCDAVTSKGAPCRNRAVDEVGGRQFCRVYSHEDQIRALAAPPVDSEESEPVDAPPEPEEAVEEPVEESPVPSEPPSKEAASSRGPRSMTYGRTADEILAEGRRMSGKDK